MHAFSLHKKNQDKKEKSNGKDAELRKGFISSVAEDDSLTSGVRQTSWLVSGANTEWNKISSLFSIFFEGFYRKEGLGGEAILVALQYYLPHLSYAQRTMDSG